MINISFHTDLLIKNTRTTPVSPKTLPFLGIWNWHTTKATAEADKKFVIRYSCSR